LLILACCPLTAADIAHVGFRVADIEKTRAFYTGVLHIQQAYDQKDAGGKTTLAVFKINDDQFLEFSPGAPAGFTHVAFLTEKIEDLRQRVETLGLNPPALRTGRDRTRNFSIKDPDDHRVEFVEYEADSMQAQGRGKFNDNRKVVSRIDHVGLPVANRESASAFFQGKLGFAIERRAVEFLPAGASFHLCLSLATGEVINAKRDPDGLEIELK
jgi:catechol 2,3-dioxygenase-like lactoylglutathione lyase family enzyme